MSDVPEGYKMSEVGVIPKEWEVETLGDIFTFGGGYSASWDQLSSEGYCYLHYGDIHKSVKSFIDVRAEYPNIPKLNILLKRISPKSLLHDGDIVFVDASEDDEGTSKHIVVVNNENITYISGLHTIVAKSKVAVLDNGYKRYCFQSRDIKKQFYFYAVGTKVSGISKTNIAKLKLPIPPLHEQQAIASALSDVDALIAALEQLITKKRNIKQGAMQQLLTGKKRLPGFSGEWEVKKLGEYSEFHKGKGLPKSEITTNGKYKCIHYGELFTTYNEEIKEVFSRTDKKDNFFLSRANDVLMPTSDVTPNGLATASCIKENEVILGGDVLVIRALADVLDGLFLSYSITQNKKQIMQLVSGSTVYHLYGSDMKKYQFNIPPTKEEQQAIAQILSDMDTGIESLEQKRDKYKAIKQGMMQELLTGKRRLA
jgi:type I restriction enzyme S subunit